VDRPPTILGLKVALPILLNASSKYALRKASPCAAGCDSILNQNN